MRQPDLNRRVVVRRDKHGRPRLYDVHTGKRIDPMTGRPWRPWPTVLLVVAAGGLGALAAAVYGRRSDFYGIVAIFLIDAVLVWTVFAWRRWRLRRLVGAMHARRRV